MTDSASLEKTYQKKTDRQHILDAPDTYIGSVEETEYDTFVLDRRDDEDNKITKKQINIIPGLYKLFDEGIVNCRDHVARMAAIEKSKENHHVSYINISINEEGVITMINDGNGIDVAKLAGMPSTVLQRARTLLTQLTQNQATAVQMPLPAAAAGSFR